MMWQQFVLQFMPAMLKLPGWMTAIGKWVGDRVSDTGHALYETLLSPMLTWLGGIMFAQGRALLNAGFSIWKSCSQVALDFVQKKSGRSLGGRCVFTGILLLLFQFLFVILGLVDQVMNIRRLRPAAPQNGE